MIEQAKQVAERLREGDRFAKLTAITYLGKKPKRGDVWLCQCDCGGTIEANATNLLRGKNKSCGCLNAEARRKTGLANTSHAHSKKHMPFYGTYRTWAGMKSRCQKPNSTSYKYYGAKGITVCEAWESFEAFLEDMGERPEGCTLDRIDPTLGYWKENCRWATPVEQSNNKTNNRLITAFGKTQTLSIWARELGCDPSAITFRLKSGWSVEDALTKPPRKLNFKKDMK